MTGVFYKPGSWNVHCDVCGFKFKSDQVMKRWDGLMVCENDFEHDHPQKFLRVREDRQSVPFVRKQADDTFIADTCDFWGASPMADYAVADCAYVGGNTSIDFLRELYAPATSNIAAIAIAGRMITNG